VQQNHHGQLQEVRHCVRVCGGQLRVYQLQICSDAGMKGEGHYRSSYRKRGVFFCIQSLKKIRGNHVKNENTGLNAAGSEILFLENDMEGTVCGLIRKSGWGIMTTKTNRNKLPYHTVPNQPVMWIRIKLFGQLLIQIFDIIF